MALRSMNVLQCDCEEGLKIVFKIWIVIQSCGLIFGLRNTCWYNELRFCWVAFCLSVTFVAKGYVIIAIGIACGRRLNVGTGFRRIGTSPESSF